MISQMITPPVLVPRPTSNCYDIGSVKSGGEEEVQAENDLSSPRHTASTNGVDGGLDDHKDDREGAVPAPRSEHDLEDTPSKFNLVIAIDSMVDEYSESTFVGNADEVDDEENKEYSESVFVGSADEVDNEEDEHDDEGDDKDEESDVETTTSIEWSYCLSPLHGRQRHESSPAVIRSWAITDGGDSQDCLSPVNEREGEDNMTGIQFHDAGDIMADIQVDEAEDVMSDIQLYQVEDDGMIGIQIHGAGDCMTGIQTGGDKSVTGVQVHRSGGGDTVDVEMTMDEGKGHSHDPHASTARWIARQLVRWRCRRRRR